VTITATFVNPFSTTAPAIPVTRVIAVMNWAGVNT
jgi:hypothetical protein